MTQDKVSRQELRDMRVGQTRIFLLNDKKKLSSARATCAQMKAEENLEYTVKVDYESVSISITRIV